jgi:hypothetical protein
VPELGTLGSVRGALSNERPYRDRKNCQRFVKSLRSATPLANGPMYLNVHVNLSSAIGSRFARNLTPANSLF